MFGELALDEVKDLSWDRIKMSERTNEWMNERMNEGKKEGRRIYVLCRDTIFNSHYEPVKRAVADLVFLII